jgi:hypothetical protein
MKEQMDFNLAQLTEVATALREIETSIGAQFGGEITAFLKEIEQKEESSAPVALDISRLEKLNKALHDLEVRYGISLGQTVYHFMHAFHKR